MTRRKADKPLSFNEYQRQSLSTAGTFTDARDQTVFSALEICAEAGELANLVYKTAYQGHPLDYKKVILEIGDVLWGLAVIADAIGVSLEDVARANRAKLIKRYGDGFSTEKSIARIDVGDEETVLSPVLRSFAQAMSVSEDDQAHLDDQAAVQQEIEMISAVPPIFLKPPTTYMAGAFNTTLYPKERKCVVCGSTESAQWQWRMHEPSPVCLECVSQGA